MVFMPPGSAKSIYSSQILPSYWLSKWPRSAIVAVSHNSELAESFGRKTRNLVNRNSATLGYSLREDSKAAGRWETDKDGEYFAIGIGGGVTGRRADLIVIDDPVRDRVTAYNDGARESIWDYYRTSLHTRLKPDGCIVLVMTRWHEADIAGRLLDEQSLGGEQWEVLSLPAFAEDPRLSTEENPIGRDPLGRAPGEPLWPEWQDARDLESRRAVLGELDFSALYQQRPKPAEGLLFDVKKIGMLTEEPKFVHVVRSWDLAATDQIGSNDPDWTVGVKIGRTEDGRFVVTDVCRFRGPPNEVEDNIRRVGHIDGHGVQIRFPEDPGQAGKSQSTYIAKFMAGYNMTFQRETGAKATRAMPVVSQVNVGNLYTTDAPWRRGFLAELRDFPHGRKDDQVDALSGGFEIVGMGRGPMRINRNLVGR